MVTIQDLYENSKQDLSRLTDLTTSWLNKKDYAKDELDSVKQDL